MKKVPINKIKLWSAKLASRNDRLHAKQFRSMFYPRAHSFSMCVDLLTFEICHIRQSFPRCATFLSGLSLMLPAWAGAGLEE